MTLQAHILPNSATTPSPQLHQLETIVTHYLPLVYASALRQLKDPHLASDVSQAVFLTLQQKLPLLDDRTILSLWLLRTTRYACLDAARRNRRRSFHETKAATMRTEIQEKPSATEDISPLIDEILHQLPTSDRLALITTYFKNLPHRELARRLKISEQAAHKRVQRALAKVRNLLDRRGVHASLPALSTTLPTLATLTPPASVSTAVTAVIQGHVPAAIHALTKGTSLMMTLLHAKSAALISTVLVAGLALTFSLAPAQPLQPPTTPPAPPATAPAVPTLNGKPFPTAPHPDSLFTAVQTLTIFESYTDGRTNIAADLDLNKVLTPEDKVLRGDPEIARAVSPDKNFFPGRTIRLVDMYGQLAELGVDLLYEHDALSDRRRNIVTPERRFLTGIDMVAVPMQSSPDIVAVSNPADQAVMRDQMIRYLLPATPSSPVYMTAALVKDAHMGPVDYGFRTREGALGILYVRRIDEQNASAEIRYTLLTPAARDQGVTLAISKILLPAIHKNIQALATDQPKPAAALALLRSVSSLFELTRGTPWHPPAKKAASASRRLLEAAEDNNTPQLQTSQEELQQLLPSFPQGTPTNALP